MININDVIDDYGIDIEYVASKIGMDIKHKGSYNFTNCPMSDHDDKNPSAYFKSGDKALYCPGCVKSIGIMTLIQEQLGFDFKSAARWLEDSVGITDEERKKKPKKVKKAKNYSKSMNFVGFVYPKTTNVKCNVSDFMSEKEKIELLKSMIRLNTRKAIAAKGYCEKQGIAIVQDVDNYITELGKHYHELKK